jgi:adenylate kinase family enzyme
MERYQMKYGMERKHLRVFGCRAFVHVPKDERAKLDAKTKECIYLGSPRDELGFRLWDPATKKLVRSRDVVFYEDQTIHDIQSKKLKTIVVHNSGGDIPQMNYDRDQPTHPDQMEQPDQIEQDQEMHEKPMADDDDDEMDQEPQLRRSTRSKKPSKRYFSGEYVTLTDEGEPQSFMEAIETDDKDKWMQAMQEELQSLKENQTYDLVKLPKGRRALKNKWVFKLKSRENNPNPRYKARIVVKGCHQKKALILKKYSHWW